MEVNLRSEEWDWARGWSKTSWSEPGLGVFQAQTQNENQAVISSRKRPSSQGTVNWKRSPDPKGQGLDLWAAGECSPERGAWRRTVRPSGRPPPL